MSPGDNTKSADQYYGGGREPFGIMPSRVKAADWGAWLARNRAESLYRMAAFSYVLGLARTRPHVRIELSEETWHRLHWPRVSYPRPLPVCPPPAGSAPAPGQKER